VSVLKFHSEIDGKSGPEHEYFTDAAAEVFAVGRGRVVDENGDEWFELELPVQQGHRVCKCGDILAPDYECLGCIEDDEEEPTPGIKGGQGRPDEQVENDSRAFLVVLLAALFIALIWVVAR